MEKRSWILIHVVGALLFTTLQYTEATITHKHLFVNATSRNAVCNDGTPSGFYIARSVTNSTKWILWLNGGGLCFDQLTCTMFPGRPTELKSSSEWKDTLEFHGWLSTDPSVNPFWDFNFVFVEYCTSDLFTGNQPTNSWGWSFFGANIVPATIEDLTNPGNNHFIRSHHLLYTDATPYPNLINATEILFGGSSAGGHGVIQNLHCIEQTVTWAPVKAIADGSWLVNVTQFSPLIPPLEEIALLGYNNWNGQVNPACREQQVKPYQCYSAQLVYQYLPASIPLFIQQPQTDSWLMEYLLGIPPDGDYSDKELKFLNNWSAQVRDSFVNASATNVFSSNCVAHVMFDEISNVSVRGYPLNQVVVEWYTGALNNFYLVDCCTDLDCNPTCGAPCADNCTYIMDCPVPTPTTGVATPSTTSSTTASRTTTSSTTSSSNTATTANVDFESITSEVAASWVLIIVAFLFV